MPWMFQEFLEIEVGIGEAAPGFRTGECQGIGQLGLDPHDAQSRGRRPATRSLDDGPGSRLSPRSRRPPPRRPARRPRSRERREPWQPACARLAAILSPMVRIGGGAGTDEGEPVGLHLLGKGRVLGEEAVAWMNCLGASGLGSQEEGGGIEVAARRRGRTDAHRFVGQPEVAGGSIGLGMDDHGLQTELAAGPLDAKRDLARELAISTLSKRRLVIRRSQTGSAPAPLPAVFHQGWRPRFRPCRRR